MFEFWFDFGELVVWAKVLLLFGRLVSCERLGVWGGPLSVGELTFLAGAFCEVYLALVVLIRI